MFDELNPANSCYNIMLGVFLLPNCQLPVLLMEISAIHSGGRIQVPSLPAQTHFSNPHRDLTVKNVLAT